MKKITLTTIAIISLLSVSSLESHNVSANGYSDKTITQNIKSAKSSAKSFWKKVKNYSDKNTPKDVVDSIKNKVSNKLNNGAPKVTSMSSDEQSIIETLKNTEFQSGQDDIMQVNNGKVTYSFNWTENHVEYSNLDSLNRVGTATAYLTKSNLGSSEDRASQTFLPTAFHKNGKQDRGHLIAYTLTFNLDNNGNYKKGEKGSINNPKNLFTQTSASNRGSMQTIEEQVRKSLKSGHKVIYKVTPIFRGDELMARGVWVQALSDDNSLNVSEYLFNVANGIKYNYADGSKQSDKSWIVK